MSECSLWRYQTIFTETIKRWRNLLKINISWELEAEKKALRMFPQDERKLKQVITKTSLLTSAQVFEKVERGGVKNGKGCRILCELRSVKNKNNPW